MYMGVILLGTRTGLPSLCIPHVYGGDPKDNGQPIYDHYVFPMYMGVIPRYGVNGRVPLGIPHVYGGDPRIRCMIGNYS